MTSNESGTTTAAIYVRLSRDPDGSRAAVERQEAACRKLAELRDWSVVRVFCDNDISAYNGARRPDFEAMLKAIESGEIGAVIAWHQDRVCRRMRELSALLDAMKATRCRWATVTGGDIDPTTATGEMLATIIGAVAQQESAHKSERQKLKYEQMAERGEPGGRRRAFGYVDGQRSAILEAEANLVREAKHRVLSGEAVGTVVKDWNRRGVPTATGKAPWNVSVLRDILASPELSARRSVPGPHSTRRIVADGKWDAILTVDESDRLRALLSDPRRRTNAGRPAAYLLTGGVARCGVCDAPLAAQPRERIPWMACRAPGCGRIRVTSRPVETIVAEAVLRRVEGGALTKLLERKADPSLIRKLRGVEARLLELSDLWAAGELSTPEWKRARARLEADQKALSARLDSERRVEGLDGLPDALRANWDDLSLARKRAVVRALVQAVIVAPSTTNGVFQPERVSITWRT